MFVRPDGGRLSRFDVRSWSAETCRRAGLAKVVNAHGLRHTAGSHLGLGGAHPRAIQEYLGHSTITMAMRYCHVTDGALRDAVKQLDGPKVGPATHAQGTEAATPTAGTLPGALTSLN